MRTLILAIALTAVAPVMGYAQSPSWQTNYSAAQQKAASQQKPLAVIFGQGANGQQQLTGGAITNDANRTLADRYVCCYIDTSSPAGQQLARQFGIESPVGLVISDRSGNLQAFWHQGNLPADALAASLTRFADPQRAVTTTETNSTGIQNSLYPPTAPLAGFGGNDGFAGMAIGYPGAGGGYAGGYGGGCGAIGCGAGGCGGSPAMGCGAGGGGRSAKHCGRGGHRGGRRGGCR